MSALINKNGLQKYSISKRNGLVVNYDMIVNTIAINNGASVPSVSTGASTVSLFQAATVSLPQISRDTFTGIFLPGDVISETYGADTVSYTVSVTDNNASIAANFAAALVAYQIANPGGGLALDLIIASSSNYVSFTFTSVNNPFAITSSVVAAPTAPIDFQLKNFGQAISSNINETITGILDAYDSAGVEKIVFTPISIDGIPVKPNSLLNKAYSVRIDNIVLVEPQWRRPVQDSPTVLYIMQDGLYSGIAKSYTIPYTIAQVWNYILTGSY